MFEKEMDEHRYRILGLVDLQKLNQYMFGVCLVQGLWDLLLIE